MMMEIVIKGAHSESTILIRVACSLRVCEIDKGAVNFITGRAKGGVNCRAARDWQQLQMSATRQRQSEMFDCGNKVIEPQSNSGVTPGQQNQ